MNQDRNGIPHQEELVALHGAYSDELNLHRKDVRTLAERTPFSPKLAKNLEDAIRRSGLQSGMTISFHHHFRNGDAVVCMVLDKLAEMGFRDLTVAASSLTDCHAPLIRHIQSGVIRRIETSGMRGKLADAVSHGLMEVPVVFRSHGGRAYAIESGELHIDVAFLGAPSCDAFGNANGYARDGGDGVICGSMGYAMQDARYADKTVIITNHLVPYPNAPYAIPENDVDLVVCVDTIGDPAGIMSGATRFTKNPKELLIAEQAAKVIEHSGHFYDGFSMQMGSGGASLATVRFLREKMIEKNYRASFALGGITGSVVKLFEEGLVRHILDVQSFDLDAAASLRDNRFHQQISAGYYASPANPGTTVNQLDVVVLSALEADVNFNVNVLTGADGVIRGAVGGHPDTAAGASVSIVVAPLTRGRIPTIVEHVSTVVTPGRSVDVIVTEQGIAVNPNRPDLAERLTRAGLPVCPIETLAARARRIVGEGEPIRYTDQIVGVVAYRDNSIIDVIRRVAD